MQIPEFFYESLVPLLSHARAAVVILTSDNPELATSLTIGAALQSNKPIVKPGVKVPEALSKNVYRFIEMGSEEALNEAMCEVMAELVSKGGK